MELRRNKKNICEELFLSEASLMPAPLRLNFNHSVLESFVQILMLMKKTWESIKVISTYDTAGSRHLKAKIIASYYIMSDFKKARYVDKRLYLDLTTPSLNSLL